MSGPTARERQTPNDDALHGHSAKDRERIRRESKATSDARAREKAEKRRLRYRRRNRREPWLKAGGAVLAVLPLGVAARIGEAVGGAIYRLSPATRERMRKQLTIAFGTEKTPAELDGIARSALRLLARGGFSMPSIARRGADRLLELVDVEDEHYLRTAVERGKGVIVVTYHFGLPDAGATWLSRHWNGVVVSSDAPEKGALRMLIGFRDRLGGATLERGNGRAMVRALRENRPVAMVADHDVSSVRGVFVPFFGRLAHTPLGPAALAQRLGATIVPTVVEWTSHTTHRIRFLGALVPREDLPRAEAAHELTYRYTKLGEEAIRARPDHWLWGHRRWQTRPEDRPEQAVWTPAPG